MNYIRTLKKQLDFTGSLIDLYELENFLGTYTVTKDNLSEQNYPKGMYTLIRILSGELIVTTKDETLVLKAEGLLILFCKNIRTLTAYTNTTVTFYNFISEKIPLFFQLEQLYYISFDQQETHQKKSMLSPNRIDDLIANSALNAIFRAQYYDWIQVYKKDRLGHDAYEQDIRQAVEYIEENLGEKINFTQLSKTLNLSERNFRKMFTLIMGNSPKAYQQDLRLKTAASLIKSSNKSMAEISEEMGYYSQFQFSRDFKTRFGTTPSAYKKTAAVTAFTI